MCILHVVAGGSIVTRQERGRHEDYGTSPRWLSMTKAIGFGGYLTPPHEGTNGACPALAFDGPGEAPLI